MTTVVRSGGHVIYLTEDRNRVRYVKAVNVVMADEVERNTLKECLESNRQVLGDISVEKAMDALGALTAENATDDIHVEVAGRLAEILEMTMTDEQAKSLPERIRNALLALRDLFRKVYAKATGKALPDTLSNAMLGMYSDSEGSYAGADPGDGALFQSMPGYMVDEENIGRDAGKLFRQDKDGNLYPLFIVPMVVKDADGNERPAKRYVEWSNGYVEEATGDLVKYPAQFNIDLTKEQEDARHSKGIITGRLKWEEGAYKKPITKKDFFNGVWQKAEMAGKMIGFALRYGWHIAAGLPSAPWLMNADGEYDKDRVFAKVEYGATNDYNKFLEEKGVKDWKGEILPDGYYNFRESGGSLWVIADKIRVAGLYTEEERQRILAENGCDEYYYYLIWPSNMNRHVENIFKNGKAELFNKLYSYAQEHEDVMKLFRPYNDLLNEGRDHIEKGVNIWDENKVEKADKKGAFKYEEEVEKKAGVKTKSQRSEYERQEKKRIAEASEAKQRELKSGRNSEVLYQDSVKDSFAETEEKLRNNPLNFDKDGNHLAPNGKKSNLSYEQWVTARTPGFKTSFGDWVHRVIIHGSIPKTFEETRQALRPLTARTFTNSETGMEMTLSNKSIDKLLSGAAVEASKEAGVSASIHKLACANLENLMHDAKLLMTVEGDEKGLLKTHRFINGFEYEGKVYGVLFTVKEFEESRSLNGTPIREYSLQGMTIEKADTISAFKVDNPRGNILYRLTPEEITDFWNGVKDVSAIRDENGEPKEEIVSQYMESSDDILFQSGKRDKDVEYWVRWDDGSGGPASADMVESPESFLTEKARKHRAEVERLNSTSAEEDMNGDIASAADYDQAGESFSSKIDGAINGGDSTIESLEMEAIWNDLADKGTYNTLTDGQMDAMIANDVYVPTEAFYRKGEAGNENARTRKSAVVDRELRDRSKILGWGEGLNIIRDADSIQDALEKAKEYFGDQYDEETERLVRKAYTYAKTMTAQEMEKAFLSRYATREGVFRLRDMFKIRKIETTLGERRRYTLLSVFPDQKLSPLFNLKDDSSTREIDKVIEFVKGNVGLFLGHYLRIENRMTRLTQGRRMFSEPLLNSVNRIAYYASRHEGDSTRRDEAGAIRSR